VAEEIHDKQLHFSDKAQAELEVITRAIVDILNLTVEAFEFADNVRAAKVEPLEQVVDSLKIDLRNRHVRRLQEGRCTIELGFVLTDLLTNYERVSDHCSNVAVTVIQIKDSSMDAHGYLNELKSSGSPEYTHAYDDYLRKYTLPSSHA